MALLAIFIQTLVVFSVLQGQTAQKTCSPTRRGVTDAEKNEILKAHNTLRQKVANGQQKDQPGASNMNQLTWNSNLAAAAQRLADTCTFNHDYPKVSGFKYVGQNLYMSWGSSSNNEPFWTKAVQSWFDEVEKFNTKSIDKYEFDPITGHYTQVVWATTKQVGCGYTFYGPNNSKLYVCNYGEGGNIISYSMYSRGNACSQCTKCSTDYPGLCSP